MTVDNCLTEPTTIIMYTHLISNDEILSIIVAGPLRQISDKTLFFKHVRQTWVRPLRHEVNMAAKDVKILAECNKNEWRCYSSVSDNMFACLFLT